MTEILFSDKDGVYHVTTLRFDISEGMPKVIVSVKELTKKIEIDFCRKTWRVVDE